MAQLSTQQRDQILHAVLQLDHPTHLAKFQEVGDEETWLNAHAPALQAQLQAVLPATIDPSDPEIWRYIRSELKHLF